MSAFSYSPATLFPPEGMYVCTITEWDNGKQTVIGGASGATEDLANYRAGVIVASLNSAFATPDGAADQRAHDEWADGEGAQCLTTTGFWHAALAWERSRKTLQQ